MWFNVIYSLINIVLLLLLSFLIGFFVQFVGEFVGQIAVGVASFIDVIEGNVSASMNKSSCFSVESVFTQFRW